MSIELEVREAARGFHDAQSGIRPEFDAQVVRYLASIPLLGSEEAAAHCPVCEARLCGVCGRCHENDKEFVFLGPHCPAAVGNESNEPCVAWTYAYRYIVSAERKLGLRPPLIKEQKYDS